MRVNVPVTDQYSHSILGVIRNPPVEQKNALPLEIHFRAARPGMVILSDQRFRSRRNAEVHRSTNLTV